MLSFTVKPFSCSKGGNSSIENEDAFVVPPEGTKDSNVLVAIADGATESSFSKEWADLLVSYFNFFDYDNNSFNSHIHAYIRKRWLDRINATELEWYAQQKLELGAFASFSGIDINLETGVVDIIAVGDSNVFVFRNGKMELSFPIEKSADFSNTPFLISTEAIKNQRKSKFFLVQRFTLVPGDILMLGTDAISQWILKEVELGNNPVAPIMQILYEHNDQDEFRNWLDNERKNLAIKNDDTTILLIQLVDGITERSTIL